MASYNVWTSLGANIADLSQSITDTVATTATDVFTTVSDTVNDFLGNNTSDEIKLTEINDVISTYNTSLSSLRNSISELNNSSLKYIEDYDKYVYMYLYDASILKNKMIEVVERTVNDELK